MWQRGSPSRTAPDKLNHLQSVAFPQICRRPLLTRNDGTIQFHRDPVWLQPQSLYKSGKRERAIELAGLAVDLEFHLEGFGQQEDRLLLHFAQLELSGRRPPLVVGLDQHGGIRQQRFLCRNLNLGAAI